MNRKIYDNKDTQSPGNNVGSLWTDLRRYAEEIASEESLLIPQMEKSILMQPSFEHALALYLATKLEYRSEHSGGCLHNVFLEAFSNDPEIIQKTIFDLQAIVQRDPACDSVLIPFLWYKGFQAIACQRVAHWLWIRRRQYLARHLQSLASDVFAVDIHPAAQLGKGILLDHATGFVVGETAVIEDNVSILHSVTLGGTGKDKGDRHPKVRRGVLIGAGVTILGNIEIGEGAKIGAGSVVLEPVEAHTTVVGVPAKVVGQTISETPSLDMDHSIWYPSI